MAVFVQSLGNAQASGQSSPWNGAITSAFNTTIGNWSVVGIASSASTSMPTTLTDSVGNIYSAFGSTGSTGPNVQGFVGRIVNQIVVGTTISFSGWSLTRNFAACWDEITGPAFVTQDANHRSTGTSTTPSDTLPTGVGSAHVIAVMGIASALGDGLVITPDAEYETGGNRAHAATAVQCQMAYRSPFAGPASTVYNPTLDLSKAWHIIQQSYRIVAAASRRSGLLPMLGAE